MSAEIAVVFGSPTPDEASAVLAAVQALLELETGMGAEHPWPYRSAWRREAISEGVNRADVS